MRLFPFLRVASATALGLFLSLATARAGSATWSANPTSGDWNTAANWVPNTVPNSPTNIATFGASDTTTVSITNTDIDLDSAVFRSDAPPYTITFQIPGLEEHNLTFNGAGIINNSGAMQSFVLSNASVAYVQISFYNSASTGEMTTYSTATSGNFVFYDSSSAGSATFNLTGGAPGGTSLEFAGSATAGDATINASGGAVVVFSDSSVGSNAIVNLTSPSFSYLKFVGNSNAEHLKVNCNETYGVLFVGTSSAGDGTFSVNPGNTTTQTANTIYFADSATAGNATFVLNGSVGAGFLSSTLLFYDSATAANATITAYGGSNGGPGAAIEFHGRTDGGTASLALLGNSTLDVGKHLGAPATLGSLSGSGTVYLGARTFALGSNNSSTTFAGVIQDSGGRSQNTGGSLSKVGTGTLTLAGMNLYTGGTTISAGVLRVVNPDGSATGSGSVHVDGGTLGGKGFIGGAVTVGTGSGTGAFLAPAVGTKRQVTLTIQSTLILDADATYTCTYKARGNQSRSDEVIANGVTINGATINLSGQAQGRLSPGLTLTLINNTSASPISGTFTNLPDGAVISAGRNQLQASYEGGDGNDLTLTVQ